MMCVPSSFHCEEAARAPLSLSSLLSLLNGNTAFSPPVAKPWPSNRSRNRHSLREGKKETHIKPAAFPFHRAHTLPNWACMHIVHMDTQTRTHTHTRFFPPHFLTLGRRWTHIVDCWVKRSRISTDTRADAPYAHAHAWKKRTTAP